MFSILPMVLLVAFAGCSKEALEGGKDPTAPVQTGEDEEDTGHDAAIRLAKLKPIAVKEAGKHECTLAVLGDDAKGIELEFQGEVPWMTVEKGATLREGRLQEFVLHCEASQDLFPRTGRLVLADGRYVEVTQPGVEMTLCTNYLGFFAPANIASLKDKTFATTPTRFNTAEWVAGTDPKNSKFGLFYAFAELAADYSVQVGILNLYIPTKAEVEGLFDGEWYDATAPTVHKIGPAKWATLIRCEWIAGKGLKMRARYLGSAPEPTEDEIEKPEFWTDPKIAGGDVVRYFPALGFHEVGPGQVQNRGEYGYYWTCTESDATTAYAFSVCDMDIGNDTFDKVFGRNIRLVVR